MARIGVEEVRLHESSRAPVHDRDRITNRVVSAIDGADVASEGEGEDIGVVGEVGGACQRLELWMSVFEQLNVVLCVAAMVTTACRHVGLCGEGEDAG